MRKKARLVGLSKRIPVVRADLEVCCLPPRSLRGGSGCAADEADKVRAWISRLHPDARTLLDVACGTGEHARLLRSTYQVDGVDLNPEFVRIAQEKNPHGQYFTADMTHLELGKTYDVVTCLFSSIGYVKDADALSATVRSFAKHLNPGGVMLIEPWFTPEVWVAGTVQMVTLDEPGFKICRMHVSERPEGHLSMLKFHYVLGTADGVRHFTEDHALTLFTIDEMKRAFTKNGLQVRYDEAGIFGRGLYIGRREPIWEP